MEKDKQCRTCEWFNLYYAGAKCGVCDAPIPASVLEEIGSRHIREDYLNCPCWSAPAKREGGQRSRSWFCSRCKVEVHSARCPHCGKSSKEKSYVYARLGGEAAMVTEQEHSNG